MTLVCMRESFVNPRAVLVRTMGLMQRSYPAQQKLHAVHRHKNSAPNEGLGRCQQARVERKCWSTDVRAC